MKIATLSLCSVALLLGGTALADHGSHGEPAAPTAEECEVLMQAHADAMESATPMSDEDMRRLEMCDRGMEMEHGDGHGNDHHGDDSEHGDHGDRDDHGDHGDHD